MHALFTIIFTHKMVPGLSMNLILFVFHPETPCKTAYNHLRANCTIQPGCLVNSFKYCKGENPFQVFLCPMIRFWDQRIEESSGKGKDYVNFYTQTNKDNMLNDEIWWNIGLSKIYIGRKWTKNVLKGMTW